LAYLAFMPTLLRWNGYRFFFWSGDRSEPPHVHVKRGSAEAKFWLEPVGLATAVDLKSHEINSILRKVREQQPAFLRAWHDHFRH
jgi:hypothetical protein